MQLIDSAGNRIVQSRRKTGFVGFLVAIRSLQAMYRRYVYPARAPLQYLLTYKMSQDHLELFFGAVRSAGGYNNNPTSQQFMSAYKQLLMRHQIKGDHGNCLPHDGTSLLTAVTDSCVVDGLQTSLSDVAISRRYDLELRAPADNVHDYTDAPNIVQLSDYKEAAVSYIAGFVVGMVHKRISCPDCLMALEVADKRDSQLQFVNFKDRGGLVQQVLVRSAVRLRCASLEC